MATISPSPTVTSQAATTITISANTCPSSLPHMRENATSARLAALSISSRHSRITSGLRCVSTPADPMQKMIAETARYQPIAISVWSSAPRSSPAALAGMGVARGADALDLGRGHRLGDPRAGGLGHGAGVGRARSADPQSELLVGALQTAAATGEHDGTHGRNQQQDRSDLEREQVLGQEQGPDVGGSAEPRDIRSPLPRDSLQR